MPRYLAVDADAHGLFVASGGAARGAVTFDKAAALGGTPPLSVSTAEELGGRLKTLLAEAGISPAPLLLCVGRDKVILKDVKHPPVPPQDEPAAIRFQAIKELSDGADDVVMDYAPGGDSADGMKHAHVAFARADVLVAARTFAAAAGLKLAGVTPRPFALAVAVDAAAKAGAGLALAVADAATVVLCVWDEGGEFAVVRGKRVLFARPLSAAAAGSDSALLGEVKRNLAVYAGQHPKHPVEAVYVAGADEAGHVAGRLAALPYPVTAFDPLVGRPTEVTAKHRGRFAGPVGLLAAAGHLPINFVTPRQPKASVNPNRVRGLVAALVAVCVLGGGFAVGQLELQKATKAVIAANQERDRADEELKRFELDAKRLAAADEFLAHDVVWLDEFYDLAARVPDNAKLKLLEFEGNVIQPPKPKPGQPATKTPKDAPVATVVAKVAADDTTQVDRFIDALNKDRFYKTTGKSVAGLAAGGGKQQQSTITTSVVRRTPDQYLRKLPAYTPPKPAAPPPAAAPTDPDFPGELP